MIVHIDTLLASGSALLAAEERHAAALPDQAARAYALADSCFKAARGAISTALAAPGDARERFALLCAAVDLDGFESPLVARAVLALADVTVSATSHAA